MLDIIVKQRSEIENICKVHGICYLGLFGSHVRNEQNPSSDVDLLVEFEESKGLLQLADVIDELRVVFHKEVDLVQRKYLDKYIAPYVMEELQTIYSTEQTSS